MQTDTEPTEKSPTADLDDATQSFADRVQWVADQAIHLTCIISTFDRDKLATGFATPQHDGTTDLAAAKLQGAMAALVYANGELLKAFIKRENEIAPAAVGRKWN